MQIPTSTRLLVIGGGPAGSTAATLLAREGFQVTLLEKETFPRYHIGESLLISVQPIIDLLGAREAVERKGFQRKKGVLWEWGGERWLFDWKKLKYDYTFHVKREEFDEILLRNSQRAGAHVFEGISVNALEFDGERPFAARWSNSKTGESGRITFDYLLDASGRAGLMTTQYLKSRMYLKAFQNVATWGYWTGANVPNVEVEGPITVGSTPNGWIWGIPLRDKTMSVGLVMHQTLFKEKRGSRSVEEIYQEGLKTSPLFQDVVLKGATLTSQIRTETDYSYISRRLSGPGYFLIGDSGAFIDPLLSSGVHLAMHSALLAAASVKSILSREVEEKKALDFYQRCYKGHFLRWALIVASFYEVNARKETYFWTAQQLAHEDLGVVNLSLADMKDVFATMVSGVVDLSDARSSERLQMGTERVQSYLHGDVNEEEITALLHKSKDRIHDYLDRVKARDPQAHLQRYKDGSTETFTMGLDADGAVGGLYVVLEPRLGLAVQTTEKDSTNGAPSKTVRVQGSSLSIYDVADVCTRRAPIELDRAQLERVASAYGRTQTWGEEQHPIYGVNTGFGELVPVMIPKQHKRELQENLIRSHAAGRGAPFADDVVRAIMLSRLNCLMKGYSGASVETVVLLGEFLNRGIHPVIPQQGSLGASGDLSPLSHLALALIGEGTVSFEGAVRPTGDVLREQGLKPLTLGFKGGLTLINGTSAMTGAACMALVRAYHLFRLAILATSDFVQCLRGSTGPFEERGHLPKNHSGQVVVARELRKLLAGSKLTSDHQELMRAIVAKSGDGTDVVDTGVYLQDAYTLRAVPQILGPVLDTLDFARKLIEEELNSTNDNPLIFDAPEMTFHGANFHGQYVAMACDYMNIAVTEIGVLAERQLNRLVDPNINGKLPPFLAASHSGLLCGFEGGQYLATSIASENLDLAAPSSIKSLPSNGSNQDVVSMGTTSARKSLQLCENVANIVSALFAACNQAAHIADSELYSPPIRELHGQLASKIPLYRDDSPIFEIFKTVHGLVTSDTFQAHLRTHVDLQGQRQGATAAE